MAEGKCFHLEVVTPDRQFYIGDADSLVLPAIDGYMGAVSYTHLTLPTKA